MRGRIWQNSSFLDRVLIPLLASAMYAAWIVPIANALFGTFMFSPSGIRVPFLMPVAVLFFGSALAHLSSESVVGRVAVAVAAIGASLLAMAILLPVPAGAAALPYYWQHLRNWQPGIPAAVAIFVLTIGLWLRAITVDWADIDSLRRGLLGGAIALALVALLGGRSFGIGLGGGISEAMLVFVLSALAALAFSDVSRMLRQSERSGGTGPTLGRYWFGTVALVIAVVVAAAWLVGALVAPDSISTIVRLIGPVLGLIRDVFAYVFLGAAYLIFLLLGPLIDWFSGLTADTTPEPQAQATSEAPNDPSLYGRGQALAVTVPEWLQAAIAVIVVGLVLFLIYRAIRKRRVARGDGVLETREVDWSWGQMREQLKGFFGRRRAKPARYLPLDDDGDPRAVVRRAYRQLLTLAEGRGLQRGRGQTPWAYGAYLSRAMPELDEPLMDLTRAYVVARYAPLPPTPDTVGAATSALQRIEEWMARTRAPAEGDGASA
ncbi:MAG: DUF4129 domain-containing protein [Anaerolineae bacterium]